MQYVRKRIRDTWNIYFSSDFSLRICDFMYRKRWWLKSLLFSVRKSFLFILQDFFYSFKWGACAEVGSVADFNEELCEELRETDSGSVWMYWRLSAAGLRWVHVGVSEQTAVWRFVVVVVEELQCERALDDSGWWFQHMQSLFLGCESTRKWLFFCFRLFSRLKSWTDPKLNFFCFTPTFTQTHHSVTKSRQVRARCWSPDWRRGCWCRTPLGNLSI